MKAIIPGRSVSGVASGSVTYNVSGHKSPQVVLTVGQYVMAQHDIDYEKVFIEFDSQNIRLSHHTDDAMMYRFEVHKRSGGRYVRFPWQAGMPMVRGKVPCEVRHSGDGSLIFSMPIAAPVASLGGA